MTRRWCAWWWWCARGSTRAGEREKQSRVRCIVVVVVEEAERQEGRERERERKRASDEEEGVQSVRGEIAGRPPTRRARVRSPTASETP